MSPEEKAFKAIQEHHDSSDFLEKYEEVKDLLDEPVESFRARIQALEKADNEKTTLAIADLKKAMRRIWGLPPEEQERSENQIGTESESIASHEEVHEAPVPIEEENEKKYTQVDNPKNGRRILFSTEDLIKEQPADKEQKYVQVDNPENGRRILFTPEAIQKQEANAAVENILKDANELATALTKEEQLLSYIDNQITKVKDDLEKRSDPSYIDSVIDQYTDSVHAGKELQDEYTFLIRKLKDLKEEKKNTEKNIQDITEKLSQ